MSIAIYGVDEILTKLEELTDESKITDALKESCALVEREARTAAPKGITGELRRSITSEVNGNEGIVFTPLEYAPYVEYGTGLFSVKGGRKNVPWSYQDERGEWHTTSGQRPQPFLEPAFNNNKEKIINIFKEALKPND